MSADAVVLQMLGPTWYSDLVDFHLLLREGAEAALHLLGQAIADVL